MNGQQPLGLLASVVAFAVAGIGIGALVQNYAIGTNDGTFVPTLASLALTAAVVFALIVLGARSDRWLENPYW